MYTKSSLSNGLTIVTHRMPNRVSLALGIWVKVGSRYEPASVSGISHFLEHLLFKGTARRSCEEIKQAIEGIGGSLNGFTAQEMSCYLAKVPGQYWADVLEVLADMVLNARLAAQDIEKERQVILEEIRMYKDLPAHFVLELLTELLWPNQPLGRNIAGELISVRQINKSALTAYKERFYRLDNIIVVACGNLRHAQLVRECARHFSSSTGPRKAEFRPVGPGQKTAQLKLQVKDTEQTHLAFGWRALSRRHRRRYTLGLLHVILGANMSSRLFREVREERGLAYEIGTAVKLFQDSGAFVVHAGIDNRRLFQTLDVILEQLEQIKRVPVPAGELTRAKEYYAGQMKLSLEDTAEHMLWLGENFISLNKFVPAQEVIREVNRVQAEDLQKLAGQIFRNRSLNLAIIGPLNDKDKKKLKQRLFS